MKSPTHTAVSRAESRFINSSFIFDFHTEGTYKGDAERKAQADAILDRVRSETGSDVAMVRVAGTAIQPAAPRTGMPGRRRFGKNIARRQVWPGIDGDGDNETQHEAKEFTPRMRFS